MRIFIAFAIADIFHELGGGVTDMERDGLGESVLGIGTGFAIGEIEGIGFGG